MSRYNVEFTLTISVEAQSRDEAEKIAWEYANNGTIDIMDAYTYVEEAKE